jgi:hypothetical protein
MYNSITSMSGGISDQAVVSNSTSALYVCFALFSLVASVPLNILGPRITLFIGTLGYLVYVAALYYYDTMKSGPVVILSGCLNGIGAALLWTAQGQLCMAYPSPETKGHYFAIFWIIFNFGAVIGGIITFVSNYHSRSDAAGPETFLIFSAIMGVGSLLSLTLAAPNTVLRPNGEKVKVIHPPHWLEELKGILSVCQDSRMLRLVPLFLYSNWFYTYHFSCYNHALFNARTEGFNNTFYWGSQMIGAYYLGQYLDGNTGSSKGASGQGGVKRRAKYSLVFVVMYVPTKVNASECLARLAQKV